MGVIAELGKLTSVLYQKFHGGPGKVNCLTADGFGGTGLVAEGFQHHGFHSVPPENTRIVFVPIGQGRRYGISVAEHNYQIEVLIADGGTVVYSTSNDGKTVQAKIELDNQGKIKISNSAKSLKAILDDLISHLSSLTTIPAVTGSPLTLNPSVIAQLTQDKANLALLLS